MKVDVFGVDMVMIVGYKIGVLKGVGVLYICWGIDLGDVKLFYGGG